MTAIHGWIQALEILSSIMLALRHAEVARRTSGQVLYC